MSSQGGRNVPGLLYFAAVCVFMLHTGAMAAWIGLVGVVAGAFVAFSGQYLMSRTERQERNTALLVEQCALIIALSEDYRNRVWEERNQVASDVVGKWDIGTYRLAEARLRVLSLEPDFLAALEALHNSGIALGRAWRLGTSDDATVDNAWAASRDALERFVSFSSQIIQPRSTRSLFKLSRPRIK
jgi:hypothetical protein